MASTLRIIGILFGTDEPFRELPDRVVTSHEHGTALLQDRDAVIFQHRVFGRVEIGEVRRECTRSRDERHVLIEKRQMR